MENSSINMTGNIPDILARIVEYKKAEVAGAVVRRGEMEALAEETRPNRRDFGAALEARDPAIIAEFKKASPSKGPLANGADPAAIARAYERGGAAALSVLTDEKFFQGGLDDLGMARGAVKLPVLRKDFTIDEFQVAEAAAHCSDAILLIATILTEKRLRQLREYAARFGMATLVEVHDETELARAAASGATIIGVNNRDLRTFEVNIETSLRLADRIPAGVLRVSESGIRSAEDIRKLRGAGYHAFLIGEHLMRSRDPEQALRALLK
jgi:indole-3-glycerol phosphate synthase